MRRDSLQFDAHIRKTIDTVYNLVDVDGDRVDDNRCGNSTLPTMIILAVMMVAMVMVMMVMVVRMNAMHAMHAMNAMNVMMMMMMMMRTILQQ